MRPSAAGASTSASSSSTFGTLPSPCGKGKATGATEQGVTNSTISIAYGDDRGFSGLPGLDQEMGDAVKAMVAWCNAQGGINGRKIVGDYYDAAVTNIGTVMTQACKKDFMLVGEGFALDGVAEQTRLGCNLAAVPGFTVSLGRGQRVRDVPGVAEPGERQPGVVGLRGDEALRQGQDPGGRRVQLHPVHPAAVDGQGRAGLHHDRLEVPQLPVPGQLQRRGQLHPVRAEAPRLRSQGRLQRLHARPDPLRRPAGPEPDRLQPDLDRGLRRLHGGLRQVEHGGPGQQRLRPLVLRAARGGQGRPGRRPVPLDPQEVRRPHLAAGRAVDLRRSSSGPPRPRPAARRSPASA